MSDIENLSEDTSVCGPDQDDPDADEYFEEDGEVEYEPEYDCTVHVMKLHKNAELPKFAMPGDAGADLAYSPENPDDDIVLPPFGRMLIPTGIAIALPEGFEAQIRPRSSAFKTGLMIMNSPGTIDSGYRGQVMLAIINMTPDKRTITSGQRLAQMVIQRLPSVQFVETKELDDTERGAGAFGSTGA